MKIIVEVSNEEMKYDFEIGKGGNHHGIMPFSEDCLICFTELLKIIVNHWHHKTDKDMEEIRALAYLEKHPDAVRKYYKKYGVKK